MKTRVYASNADRQAAYRERKRNVTPGNGNVTRTEREATCSRELAESITPQTENVFIAALRLYYQWNFQNGVSHESFLLWLELKLGVNEENQETKALFETLGL